MNILAIDTSQPVGSVALRLGRRDPVAVEFGTAASHLVEVASAMSVLLSRAGKSIQDVDRLALVSGPGSFTGLRIGLAFVKGLSAARPFQVVTMTSLELLAAMAPGDTDRVCAMIDARRDEVYAAVYQRDDRTPAVEGLRRVRMVSPERAVRPAEFLQAMRLCPTCFVGSGASRYATLVSRIFGGQARVVADRDGPMASALSRLAPALEPLGERELPTVEPFYIRPGDAKLRPLNAVRAHDR